MRFALLLLETAERPSFPEAAEPRPQRGPRRPRAYDEDAPAPEAELLSDMGAEALRLTEAMALSGQRLADSREALDKAWADARESGLTDEVRNGRVNFAGGALVAYAAAVGRPAVDVRAELVQDSRAAVAAAVAAEPRYKGLPVSPEVTVTSRPMAHPGAPRPADPPTPTPEETDHGRSIAAEIEAES